MGYIKDMLRFHILWWEIMFGVFYLSAILLALATQTPMFGFTDNGQIFSFFSVYGGIFTGLIVLAIDKPSTWYGSQHLALALRLITSTVSLYLLAVFGYVTFGGKFQNLIFQGLSWLLYLLALGYSSVASRFQMKKAVLRVKRYEQLLSGDVMRYIRDALRLHIYWWGVFFGIFYVSATALAYAGALLMVFPLYGGVFSGLVALAMDRPHNWYGCRRLALKLRLIVTIVSTALLIAFCTAIYGGLKQSLIFNGIAWLLYILELGASYRASRPRVQDTESEFKR